MPHADMAYAVAGPVAGRRVGVVAPRALARTYPPRCPLCRRRVESRIERRNVPPPVPRRPALASRELLHFLAHFIPPKNI